MKNKKCTAIILSVITAANIQAAAGAYNDTHSHWAEKFIDALTASGIVQGDGTIFRPDDPVSADEFLKMTLTAMDTDIDAAGGNWRQVYVNEALKRGLIYADEIGNYANPINRGDITKIAVRAIGADYVGGARRESIISHIADYYDIYNEYKEYVLAAVDNHLMYGYEDNTYRTDRYTTRAEACVLISRIMKAGSFGGSKDQTQTGRDRIYVSANAGAGGDGSEEKPFASITEARDAVRQAIAGGEYPDTGITVYLRGGDYEISDTFELGAEDSGTDGAPVVYCSYPGETARITGSKKLDIGAFVSISKEMGDKLIDKSASSKILQTDLKKQGIMDLGQLSRRGYLISANITPQPELYINGSRMQLARWPNDTWAGTTDIVRSGARSQQGVLEGAVYKIDYDRPLKWKTNIGEIYTSGVLGPNYFYGYFPLEKIEPGQITLKEGSVTSYYSKHFIRYENIFEELDAPGEYYIDRTTGMLYLYPTEDFERGSDICLSMMSDNIIGANNARNIVLKDLRIDSTRASAIRAESVNNFKIENCEISGTGAMGVYIRGTGCTVENSVIHDIGATGISLNGGDYENIISANNAVINNHIYRVAQLERSYQAGITLGYRSVGALVSHNEIHDMPHAAMIIYGPEHIVEYNNIYDAVQEFHDMDAIYMNVNQYPWERNVIIRRNYIHDLGQHEFTEKQMNVAAIRTDNNGNGLTVKENIFYNIGYKDSNGIRAICAQGIENVIENNIFIDTAGTFEGAHSYNPDQKWDMQNESVAAIYKQWQVFSPKYSEKNPEVAHFFEHHYAAYAANNTFKGNVTVNISFPLSELNHIPSVHGFLASDQLVDASDNIVTKTDPGFEDYAGKNFRLKDDSAVYTKISGFPKLDFENMGLLKDIKPGPRR